MIPSSSYEIAKEQQRDQREEARQERASKPPGDGGAEAARSGVRHALAGTLRRVADTLEPIT
ncbi:MAG: hypothetical protein ACRDK3_17765 [Actinomycetota bacterium]